MIPKRIDGATRYLGAPVGWEPEKSGECSHLAIVDTFINDGQPVMLSAWEPTPAEIEAINEGLPVYLQVCGTAHPPVNVFVDVEKPPRKMSIVDRDLVAKWGCRIEIFLDNVPVSGVTAYDCDAGTVTRHRLDANGRRFAMDGTVATETLRGGVEVRRK